MRSSLPAAVLMAATLLMSCTTGPSIRPGPSAPSGTSADLTPSQPAATPSASLIRVEITGATTLTSLGETSQLAGVAVFSDGTTQDVTTSAAARWTLANPTVFGMAKPGEIRVLDFGISGIAFVYMSYNAGGWITATPSGTSAVSGVVREPGQGPLSGVRVTEMTSGRSGLSDTKGIFTFGALPSSQLRLIAEKDDYEPSMQSTTPTTTNPSVDLPMQKVVHLTAGDSLMPHALAPHDLSYVVGALHCDDCRLMRVSVPNPGTLHVHITWTAGPNLTLFAEGRILASGNQELTSDLPVSAAGEVLLYLGMAPPNSLTSHTTFKVETSMS